MDRPALLPLGPDGVLVRFADRLDEPANRAALAFRAVVEAAGLDGVSETATSLTSAFVRFRPDQVSRADLQETLSGLLGDRDWLAASLPQGRKLWHIPACFEGAHAPALEEAAGLAGVSPTQAVAEVTGQSLRVLALGFAPGQPYLGFLPNHWDIPRQADVTPQVPQGAVVVAVRQVIPFANAAPTGWRQIGRTAFRLYDPKGSPALPLSPGDELRFQAVTAKELARIEADPQGGADVEVLS
ncbi:allophanate hydrolase subunit 1 [bacterium]|nr:allophanate hydrolase subunit 1 [bacterium]